MGITNILVNTQYTQKSEQDFCIGSNASLSLNLYSVFDWAISVKESYSFNLMVEKIYYQFQLGRILLTC